MPAATWPAAPTFRRIDQPASKAAHIPSTHSEITSRNRSACRPGRSPATRDRLLHRVAAEGLAQFLVDHRLDERGLAALHLVLDRLVKRAVSSSMVRA
jgi:hypothetical protein